MKTELLESKSRTVGNKAFLVVYFLASFILLLIYRFHVTVDLFTHGAIWVFTLKSDPHTWLHKKNCEKIYWYLSFIWISIAFFVENNLFEWSSFTWAYIWEKMICKVYCAWSLPFRFLQDVDFCIRWVFFLFLKSSLSPARLHLQPLPSKWDFYNKDWPITLSLKMRISVTRKWFIVCQLSQFLDWQKQNGKLSNHDLILALRVETN